MIAAPKPVELDHAGTLFESLLVAPAGAAAQPAVLVFPTIMGRSDLELGFARRLAEAGHAAMVCDLYGKAHIGRPREDCRALMNELRADRPELQARLKAWLEAVRRQPEVDAGRVAAIGYCFGGLCALDLARSGADIRGVASFHGILTPPDDLARTRIVARVILFHGWDDPLAPPEHVEALARELGEAGADWQIHAYGGTMHGFTNPKAADPASGILFNPRAAERAWRSLEGFLEECFA